MSDTDKWEIYQHKAGEYRWRRTATNGNIVGASTEGYSGKSDCQANAQRHGQDGNPKGLGATDAWEFYTDKSGEHRWRRTATNGNLVGASSESYSSKSDCEGNARGNGYSG
jgi:uncharacterized protein YegP (UPF0339 family)